MRTPMPMALAIASGDIEDLPFFGLQDEDCLEYFLAPNDERMLLKSYELNLKDFCRRFEPPMPKCIVGTAFHYFKRFYLHNSPMDYHPKEIL